MKISKAFKYKYRQYCAKEQKNSVPFTGLWLTKEYQQARFLPSFFAFCLSYAYNVLSFIYSGMMALNALASNPIWPDHITDEVPLSLAETMQLKSAIFERMRELIAWNPNSGIDCYLTEYIAFSSLDDAFELIGNDYKLCLNLLQHSQLKKKYSSQLASLIERVKKNGTKVFSINRYFPDTQADAIEYLELMLNTHIPQAWPQLKADITTYYAQFVRRKTIDGIKPAYTDNPEQYQLESLIHQMLATDIYQLQWIKSSLEALLTWSVYRKDGKDMRIQHGETAQQRSIDYLVTQITSALPQGYSLQKNDDCYEITWWSVDTEEEMQQTIYPLKEVYVDIWNFRNGLAKVTKNWKNGVINKMGEEIIACVYEEIHIKAWLIRGKNSGERWTFSGEDLFRWLSGTYDEIRFFAEGVMVKKNKMWWTVDTTEKQIIPCNYDEIRDIDEWFLAVKGELVGWGIFTSTGQEIVTPGAYREVWGFYEWFARVKDYLWHWWLIDRTGAEVIPCGTGYDNMGDVHEWFVRVKAFGNWWLIDTTGKEILPILFDDIGDVHEWFVKAKLMATWWIMDTTRDTTWNAIIPCTYYDIGDVHEWMVKVKVNANGNRGIYDKNRTKAINYLYEYIADFHDWLANVKMNGKWWLIDKKGKLVTPCIYNEIYDFDDWLAQVKMNWKSWLIDKNGKTIAPCIYHLIGVFKEWLAKTREKGKWWWLIDKSGKVILSCQRESIDFEKTPDGKILVILLNDQNNLIHYTYDPCKSLLPQVKQDLSILNALDAPQTGIKEVLENYLVKDGPNSEYRSAKLDPEQENDPTVINRVNYHIHHSPADYVWEIVAKKPTAGLSQAVIERFWPPEKVKKNRWGEWRHTSGERPDDGLFESVWGQHRTRWWNEQTEELGLQDIHFEKPIVPFITTHLLWEYANGTWHELDAGYDKQRIEGDDTTTFSNTCTLIPKNFNQLEKILPSQTNNFFIKNVTLQEKWWTLRTVSPVVKANGLSSVLVTPSTTKVIISLENSLIEPVLSDGVLSDPYQKFLNGYKQHHKDYMTWYQLPDEAEFFLDSIKDASPKEKILACEEFVRTYMRYDKENENSEQKSGKSLDEQISMCYQHRVTLLQQHPDLKWVLSQKLFVGVCEDAANLLHMLLRRTGIVCGKILGYAQGKKGRIPHSKNWVAFPGEKWQHYIYEVDGTPGNYTVVKIPTSMQREEAMKQIKEQLSSSGTKIIETTSRKTISTEAELAQAQAEYDEQIVNLEQLLEVYKQGKRDELLVAAIAQRIQQLPDDLQERYTATFEQLRVRAEK